MRRLLLFIIGLIFIPTTYGQISVQYKVVGLNANVTNWDDFRWNIYGSVTKISPVNYDLRGLNYTCVKRTGGYQWFTDNTILGFNKPDDILDERNVTFSGNAFVKRCKAGNGANGNGDDCAYKDICYCGRLGTRCSSDDDGYYNTLSANANQSFLYSDYEPGKWITGDENGDFEIYGWGFRVKMQIFWTPPKPDDIQFSGGLNFNICGGSTYTLTTGWSDGQLRGFNNASYVWQESTDNLNWVTIPSQTGATLTLTAPTNAPSNGSLARFYRVYMVYNGTQSLSPKVFPNTIYIFPSPPTDAITSTISPTCYGRGDGSIIVNAITGGAGVYYYTLSNSSGLVLNTSKPVFPITFTLDATNAPPGTTGLVAGIYTLTVENYTGGNRRCAYTETVMLNQPNPLTLQYVTQNYNGYGISCNGFSDGSVTLTGTGGNAPYSLLLDDNASVNSPYPVALSGIYTSLPAGTYYSKVIDQNNCPNSIVPITITQPAVLSSIPLTTNVRCFGNNDGLVGFTVSGGVAPYTYSTNGGQSFASANPVISLAPGTYQTVTKDLNGCTISSAINISEPSQLNISSNNLVDILCNGSATGSLQINANGGTSPYTYKLNSGLYQTNNGFNNLTAGSYALYVKDNNGCINTTNVSLTEPSAIQNSGTITNVTCYGRTDGSIHNAISGGVSPYFYTWIGRSEIVPSLSNLSAGNYSLKVRDANNCLYQETMTVSAPPSQLVVDNVTSAPATCNSICDGNISLTVSGGVAPYQYNYGNGFISGSSSTSMCGEDVNVLIRDAYGCQITENVNVALVNDISFDLPDQLLLCVGQHYPVNISDPALTVQWTSDNGFTSAAHNVDLVDPDTYYLNIADITGCYYKDTVLLQTSLDLLQARFFLPSSVSLGDTVSFVEASWPRPDSIHWDFGYNAVHIPNDDGFTELVYDQAGTYTVKMTAYLGQCRDSVSKTITFYISSPYVVDSTNLGYVGIKDFRLYPNPNHGAFTLDVWLDESSDLLATFTNQYGNLVYTMPMGRGDTFSQNFALPVLGSGVYALRLEALGDVKVIKFIVY